jgi:solute:Na+ symporter, SSS family
MNAPATALIIILAIVILGSVIGFRAGAHRKMDLEQWTVAGRGFGVVLVWLLMAGEVYTTFSFLGASGWAYSRGGPTLYILAYITLADVVAFFVLPRIWEVARAHGLQTESDYFRQRYGSVALAALVALVGVVFMIPYLELQLDGMGIIMQVASYGAIGRTPALAIGATLVAAFVFASGVRAVAWVGVLKDVLMLSAALVIGIVVPLHWFGGVGPMFRALIRAHPAHLTMPGATTKLGHSWFVSTVLLTALGGICWPHIFGASFTARSADVVRRNAAAMPLYALTLPFLMFAGFAAVLVVPGLSNGDLSLLTLIQKTFPPWLLGAVGGAGALTAMVPSAILTLTASTLFAKNLYRPLFAPAMSDDQVARLARRTAVVIMGVAVALALMNSKTIVALLLVGYAGVAQFFPGVVLGLFWRRANRTSVFAGLAVGIVVAALLMLSGRDPFMGLNAGLLALALNLAVTIGVGLSTATPAAEPA